MNGKIIAYSADVAAGIIETPDGSRHYFNKAHCSPPETVPEINMVVTFEVIGDNPKNIKILTG
jgi:hypothetical protein